MIKILITEELGSATLDKLNEIPEFEIIENTTLIPENITSEIKNIDAGIINALSPLLPAILASATGLKIIILTGGEPNHMDTEMAKQKNIEIRCIPPVQGTLPSPAVENQERKELAVIAVLKDFFNV
ncbi:MAG: hypothetical protein JXI33_01100 [Candidatus Aminicenantes bacterium]|nr:hypothetical protein [Candidatus Aminicenantes bacterium]